MIGLGLVVGGFKEGFNLNVLMGVGQAVGEVLQADARRTPLASMRAVMLEDYAMGMAQGVEGAKWKPPIHA